jgi:hypothetical protein
VIFFTRVYSPLYFHPTPPLSNDANLVKGQTAIKTKRRKGKEDGCSQEVTPEECFARIPPFHQPWTMEEARA